MSMRLKSQDIAVSVVVVFPCLLSFTQICEQCKEEIETLLHSKAEKKQEQA